jgi:hypothetical protein
MIFLRHNLGLGDHIISNALVRHFCATEEKVNLYCKPHNKPSVQFMYRDLTNIEIIEHTKENKNQAGYTKITYDLKDWDMSKYTRLGLPSSDRWDKFYLERDLNREKRLFEKYNVNKGEYVFIHDDPNRDFNIPYESDLHVIRPNENQKNNPFNYEETKTDNIFDYLYLMQNAKEIHCIDSSFRVMFDSVFNDGDFLPELYFHVDARTHLFPLHRYPLSHSKLNWNIKNAR